MARLPTKAMQGSQEVALDNQRRYPEQDQKYRIDRDHHLKGVIDDPQPAHQRVVKQDIVIEDAHDSKTLAQDCYHRHSGKKQERQQHPTQHRAHLAVEVVRQDPVGNLHRADGADVLEPVSPAEVRIPARSADERFGDEVADREGVRIAILGEAVEFVALLSVLDPYLLVTHGAGQDQARVQVDVVCSAASPRRRDCKRDHNRDCRPSWSP